MASAWSARSASPSLLSRGACLMCHSKVTPRGVLGPADFDQLADALVVLLNAILIHASVVPRGGRGRTRLRVGRLTHPVCGPGSGSADRPWLGVRALPSTFWS